jgi:hypothetical protein
MKQGSSTLFSATCLFGLLFKPEAGGVYFPLKYPEISIRLHNAVFQETASFLVTVLRMLILASLRPIHIMLSHL